MVFWRRKKTELEMFEALKEAMDNVAKDIVESQAKIDASVKTAVRSMNQATSEMKKHSNRSLDTRPEMRR